MLDQPWSGPPSLFLVGAGPAWVAFPSLSPQEPVLGTRWFRPGPPRSLSSLDLGLRVSQVLLGVLPFLALPSAQQVWAAGWFEVGTLPSPPSLPFRGHPAGNTHQLSLAAEAEGADLLGLGVPARPRRGWGDGRGLPGTPMRGRRRAPSGRAARQPQASPHQQHVAQVRDVIAGGQAQGLDLGELAAGGLGGDERA